MSDHIPFEIQSEIIKRLPVKSVIRCRSVSKQWKSLIDSRKFITSYSHTQTQHFLFIRFCIWPPDNNKFNYFSVVDDHYFPNNKCSMTVPHPVSLLYGIIRVFGSVNGLLCLHGRTWRQDNRYEKMVVIWNPSLGKAVGVRMSDYSYHSRTCIGFGVCPNTSDPTLVKINVFGNPNTVTNWEVEVFMLSTRVWKTMSNIPPAFKTYGLMSRHVCINGCIYWLAYDSTDLSSKIRSKFIISFDLRSHEFGQVCLPDRLVHTKLTVLKVYGSLGLLEYFYGGLPRFCDVWIMKEGVTKSFTKMFSIKLPGSWGRYRVMELRKNGEVIIQHSGCYRTPSPVLEVYDPSSGSINGLGIDEVPSLFSVNLSMETLLLLDEPNSIIN